MGYAYFENRSCEHYPCHNREDINCLFCFCPLYPLDDCGGSPEYIKGEKGDSIKDCSNCVFPHIADNYKEVIKRLDRK